MIWIYGPITCDARRVVVAQLLSLDLENPSKPITMFVNSPGGQVSAVLSIYDGMQYIKSPVIPICVGQVASLASLLLAAGAKGERKSFPNATITIHRPPGGHVGQAKDMSHAMQIARAWDTLNSL